MFIKPAGPYCQSCGMPLSKDAKGGGDEKDGAKSAEYCSNCYQNGVFTEPNLTVNQMIVKVKGQMKEMGIPDLVSHVLTRSTSRLKRWKKNKY